MRKDLCPSVSFIEPSRFCGPFWVGRCLEIDFALPIVVIVYDPRFLDHVPSPLHVERPDRLRSIVERLQREGLFREVEMLASATVADLRRVHRESYVEMVRTLGEGFGDPEPAIHPDTFDIARVAVGGVLLATRVAVRDGRPTVALVRPPGHHAGPDYGGGFCYLNNVAIAAAEQVAHGRRVAILDYDAHHRNGTRDRKSTRLNSSHSQISYAVF